MTISFKTNEFFVFNSALNIDIIIGRFQCIDNNANIILMNTVQILSPKGIYK